MIGAVGSVGRLGLVRAFGNLSEPGYDIIIVAGQSNMVGRGAKDATIDVTHPRVDQYGGSPALAQFQTIFQASEQLHHAEGSNPAQVGPGLAFARVYVETISANRRVLLVPCAWGGTSLGGNWNPDPNTIVRGTTPTTGVVSLLYENMIYQAQEAVTAAQAIHPASRVVGTIWHQGEGDFSSTQAVYADRLDRLIAGIRTRVPTAEQSWFIVGGLVPEQIAINTGLRTQIVPAHINTPRRTDRTGYAPGPLGYERGDLLHYNGPGARIMGARMAAQVAAAKANVTGSQPAAVPSPLRVVNLGDTAVTIEWDAPLSRATAYRIAWRAVPSGGWQSIDTATIERLVTVYGLVIGSSYEITVSTVNEQGVSAPSATLAVTTTATPPGQVTGLSVVGVTGTGVDLAWTAPTTGGTPTDYLVEYREAGALGWSTFADGVSIAPAASVTGLTAGQQYELRVTAINIAGSGTPSATVNGTPDPNAPGQVTGVATSALTHTSVVLSWTAPMGGSAVVDYRVQYREAGETAWLTYADGTSTSTTATVRGLDIDTTYDFRVAAIGSGSAAGPPSDVVTVQTMVPPVEAGATGHWLFGTDDNAASVDMVSGLTLTPRSTAPTLAGNSLTTAGRNAGLLTPINEQATQTVCMVVFVPSTLVNAVLGGTFGPTGSTGGCSAMWNAGSLQVFERGSTTGNVGAPPLGEWIFVAWSMSAGGGRVLYRGDATAPVVVSQTATRVVSSPVRSVAIGDGHYNNGSFAGTITVAETIIFNSARTTAELAAIYDRSRTRLAPRGISLR